VERIRDRVFARSWQIAADRTEVRTPRLARPFTFLEGLIDEPLLLTRDDGDRLRCMSNVCTHRGLDRVEREDEAIVEAVQRGVRSRLYDRGRYSPTREQGVHHFHRLLGEVISRQ